MKILSVVAVAIVVLAFPSPADAVASARERAVQAHIVKQLGHRFADPIIARLQLLPVAARSKGGNPKDFDYVFSPWAISYGNAFLKDNRAAFDAEEAQYGVPREVVNAILNIETQWGHIDTTKLHPVVLSLYTLAVRRPDFIQPGWAEGQLIAFLTLSKENRWDAFSIVGSRTGAFGLSQFEPASYRKRATHCTATELGPPDLFSFADAICSIGNYLKNEGWDDRDVSRQEKAIKAYNHSHYYMAAVMDYAALRKTASPLSRYTPVHLNRKDIERAASD